MEKSISPELKHLGYRLSTELSKTNPKNIFSRDCVYTEATFHSEFYLSLPESLVCKTPEEGGQEVEHLVG